jgi:hypothetical protein
MRRDVGQPPAPPGRAGRGLALDALDDDQPPRVDGQDRVPRSSGGRSPVDRRVPAAPTGCSVRLVVQVGADHRRSISITRRQRHPVIDPALLRVAVGEPQFGLTARVRPMSIEHHAKISRGRGLHHPVHDLQRGQSLQAGIDLAVDTRYRRDGPGQTFRGERQPDGVEPEGGNLIHRLIERNLPQTVRSAIRRLHPEPVDRLDREILT